MIFITPKNSYLRGISIYSLMNNYNTQRDRLIMPEYGRHIQEMVEYVVGIPDKEKRNEQIRAVVAIMGILNPQLRDLVDFKHKLWDHVHIISDFKIDIDSPYPTPTKETFSTSPHPIPLNNAPLKAAHYGRNIQNMVNMIAEKPEDDARRDMILVLAGYMRQQYLIWNKDSVSEETIFKDIYELSEGRLTVPEGLHLEALPNGGTVQGAYGHSGHQHRPNQHKHKNNNKKKNSSGNNNNNNKRK